MILSDVEGSAQASQEGGEKEKNMIFKKRSFKNLLFDLWYRFGKPPWIIDQAQPDLIAAAEKGEVRGPTVLDIGCGVGNNAIYLASRGFAVTGVDVSAKAISIAKQKALEAKADVMFMTLDALNSPFAQIYKWF